MVKLVQFTEGSGVRVGALLADGNVVDVSKSDPTIPNNMRSILEGGDAMLVKVTA